MLNFLKRRNRRSNGADHDPLAVRDLLEYPALQAVLAAGDDPDEPMSLEWARLMAAGPLCFAGPDPIVTEASHVEPSDVAA